MSDALTKPEVILTHESDLDGLISGLLLQRLARHLFQTDVKLEAFHYNAWKLRELRESSAWVCDLSFERRLDKPNWVIFDHHATEFAPEKARLFHDVKKSAGLICYELCRSNQLDTPKLDRLVHLNNVSDLFLEADPDFELAGDYANLVKSYQFWNLHSLINGDLERLLDHPLLEVMQVKRRIEDPLGFAWAQKNVTALSPTVGYVETVIGNNNLIVHQLLEAQSTPYTVLVTLFRRPNNVVIASFRSRNGEALKVAEKLQGGGHANAAGATLPKAVRNIPEAIQYLGYALNPEATKPAAAKAGLEGLFSAFDGKAS